MRSTKFSLRNWPSLAMVFGLSCLLRLLCFLMTLFLVVRVLLSMNLYNWQLRR